TARSMIAVVAAVAFGVASCSSDGTGTAGAPAATGGKDSTVTASSGAKAAGAKGTKQPKNTTGGTPLPNDVMFTNFLVRNSAAPTKDGQLPKAYRALALDAKNPPEGINATGLETFDVSGSGQFSPGELDNIVQEAKTKSGATGVLLVDL